MNPGHDGPRGRTNEDTTRQKEGKTGRSQYGEKDRNGGKNEKKGHEREKNRKIKKKKKLGTQGGQPTSPATSPRDDSPCERATARHEIKWKCGRQAGSNRRQ